MWQKGKKEEERIKCAYFTKSTVKNMAFPKSYILHIYHTPNGKKKLVPNNKNKNKGEQTKIKGLNFEDKIN